MKILLVTTNYSGGAAIACRRQHQALLAAGIDSHLLVLDKVNNPVEDNVHSIQDVISKKYGNWYFLFLKFSNRVLNKLPVYFNKKAYINGPSSVFRIDKLDIYKESDIINLHWVPKIISYKHVFKDKKKIFFWTQHDMNAFTGGNHYTLDFDYSPYKKLLKKNIEKKIQYLKGANLTIIPTSYWLGNLAKNSEVFKDFKVKVVHACIDPEIFKPIDKKAACENLNVELSAKKYILFVAENPDDLRKGIHLLIKALNNVRDKSKFCVLVIGKKMQHVQVDFELKQLGFINNISQLVNCYNAADFFIIQSIEDNLPNTVLESLACGTPVIGFNIGGIPDMVENNKSGLLCDINDEAHFVKNIESLIEMNDYNSFSKSGRLTIENKFSDKKVAKELIDLYKEALNKI